MDNIDLEGPTMDELILQNAESMKQFEYLEKSLVTFQQAVSAQASELRQPIGAQERVCVLHVCIMYVVCSMWYVCMYVCMHVQYDSAK